MSIRRRVLGLVLTLGCSFLLVQQAGAAQTGRFDLLLKPSPEFSTALAKIDTALAPILPPGASLQRLANSALLAVRNLNQANGLRLATELERRGLVEYVEPDYEVALLPSTGQFFGEGEGDAEGEEDEKNWGLGAVHAQEAWQVTEGDPELIVALLDTGADLDHEDLVDNLWVNPGEIPGNGLDDDGNGYIDDIHGYNFCEGHGSPEDDYGHGSHTAGIVAAGHNGFGTVGVAPNVKLMPLKFIECSPRQGTISLAIEAIHYAVDHGARVINNSWGIRHSVDGYRDVWGDTTPRALREAVEYANDHGVVFVASAGNFQEDNDSVRIYPAGLDNSNLIAVTSTDSDDRFHSEVNHGNLTVHVAAPGKDIYSAWMKGGYSTISGTSMAGPFVAGLAALLLSADPGATPEEVRYAIMASVDRSEHLADYTLAGGRINAARALTKDYNQEEVALDNGTCDVLWVDAGCNDAVRVGNEVAVFAMARTCNDDFAVDWTFTKTPKQAEGQVEVLERAGEAMTFVAEHAGTYVLQVCLQGEQGGAVCDEPEVKVVEAGEDIPEVSCRGGGMCGVMGMTPGMASWPFVLLLLGLGLRRRHG